ncbi:MAG: hypothetical protein KDK91_28015 [Gammaproteobacteria bacterium]|nr:hypothetical protein [Gammaproteobacteria bacterium]
MAVASAGVSAQNLEDDGLPGNLSLTEKSLFSLIEMTASILATRVDRVGCSTANYSFGGSVAFDGTGSVRIDDLSITTAPTVNEIRGTFFQTDIPTPGDIGGVQFRQSATANRHVGYVGDLRFTRLGEIAYGDAEFDLNVGSFDSNWERHDEHIIKDFFRGNVFGIPAPNPADPTSASGIQDRGLEVVTKLDFPKAKWRQYSQYYRPDGVPGRVQIRKVLIRHNNGPSCEIQMEGNVTHFDGGLFLSGASFSVAP